MVSVGDVFGRLTVVDVYRIMKSSRMRYVAKVRCDCGVEKEVDVDNLKNDKTLSCGCYKKERSTIHGVSGTRVYNIWRAINDRCYNKNRKDYNNYGGRGISLCDEWKNPIVFVEWSLLNGYGDNLVIDRINNDGNYEPSNCQWITNSENQQALKKRMKSDNTSGVTGVSFSTRKNRWISRLSVNGKLLILGSYVSFDDAVNARKQAEIDNGIFKNRRKETK